jgi:hypothetical protein
MKDRSYHESAILYNEGLAITAEEQTDRVEHPIVKKWNIAVGKQHRFHEKRHRAALDKLIARERAESADGKTEVERDLETQLNDGTGV